MECKDCKAELGESSNFCGKCGKKTSGLHSDIGESLKNHKNFWFMAGLYRGTCLANKDNNSLKAFEEIIRKNDLEIYGEYCESIEYLKNKLSSSKNENSTN